MNEVDYSSILNQLEALFAELHPSILKHWGDPSVATIKQDGSQVTIIDKMVESRLIELFARILPQAYFLGEETYDNSPDAAAKILAKELLIVVDPIDGTRNYVEGNPNFGTLIGIYHQKQGQFSPHFGLVYRPVAGIDRDSSDRGMVTFSTDTGIANHQLIYNEQTGSLHVKEASLKASVPSSTLRVVTSHRASAFTEEVSVIRSDVSIVDLMLPLSGEAEATVSRSRFWDIAGPVALSVKAGLGAYGLVNRQAIDSFSLDHFVSEGSRKWELRDYIVITSPTLVHRIGLK